MPNRSGKFWKNLIALLYFIQQIDQSYCAMKPHENNFLIPECFFHDFRLVELLRLKKSLTYGDDNTCSSPVSTECMKSDGNLNKTSTLQSAETLVSHDIPAAMALKATERGFPSSGDYHSWHHIEEQKPSKLQTLFQITITSLAFLSFGGYLLCLIVQTIKSKGTTYFHPVATATTSTNSGVKRIKVYRRSRRNAISMPPDYENANFAFYAKSNAEQDQEEEEEDFNSALPNPNDMYNTLVQFAESYVRTMS